MYSDDEIFPWTCPYCNRATTITQANRSYGGLVFNDENKEQASLRVRIEATTCPSPSCREYSLKASLYKLDPLTDEIAATLMAWQLRPQSSAKPFPDYIPPPIRADYEEACLIRDLSPKASATLSRRCLQGIIRDFWGVSKARLVDEINDLKDKIDVSTWQAIDAVRSIGNIGAHMEKDINLVIDVEPEEAQLLIGLIEILLKDWYVAKHEREEHLAGIVALAKAKAEAKQQ